MSMLAALSPSYGAKKLLEDPKGVLNDAITFVQENKMLTTAIRIAFPPANAAITALEIAGTARDVLDNNDLPTASESYDKAGGDGQAPVPMAQRLEQTSQLATLAQKATQVARQSI